MSEELKSSLILQQSLICGHLIQGQATLMLSDPQMSSDSSKINSESIPIVHYEIVSEIVKNLFQCYNQIEVTKNQVETTNLFKQTPSFRSDEIIYSGDQRIPVSEHNDIEEEQKNFGFKVLTQIFVEEIKIFVRIEILDVSKNFQKNCYRDKAEEEYLECKAMKTESKSEENDEGLRMSENYKIVDNKCLTEPSKCFEEDEEPMKSYKYTKDEDLKYFIEPSNGFEDNEELNKSESFTKDEEKKYLPEPSKFVDEDEVVKRSENYNDDEDKKFLTEPSKGVGEDEELRKSENYKKDEDLKYLTETINCIEDDEELRRIENYTSGEDKICLIESSKFVKEDEKLKRSLNYKEDEVLKFVTEPRIFVGKDERLKMSVNNKKDEELKCLTEPSKCAEEDEKLKRIENDKKDEELICLTEPSKCIEEDGELGRNEKKKNLIKTSRCVEEDEKLRRSENNIKDKDKIFLKEEKKAVENDEDLRRSENQIKDEDIKSLTESKKCIEEDVRDQERRITESILIMKKIQIEENFEDIEAKSNLKTSEKPLQVLLKDSQSFPILSQELRISSDTPNITTEPLLSFQNLSSLDLNKSIAQLGPNDLEPLDKSENSIGSLNNSLKNQTASEFELYSSSVLPPHSLKIDSDYVIVKNLNPTIETSDFYLLANSEIVTEYYQMPILSEVQSESDDDFELI